METGWFSREKSKLNLKTGGILRRGNPARKALLLTFKQVNVLLVIFFLHECLHDDTMQFIMGAYSHTARFFGRSLRGITTLTLTSHQRRAD